MKGIGCDLRQEMGNDDEPAAILPKSSKASIPPAPTQEVDNNKPAILLPKSSLIKDIDAAGFD